jgi:curli biogenesis system outer membrane secretion channel CsgG
MKRLSYMIIAAGLAATLPAQPPAGQPKPAAAQKPKPASPAKAPAAKTPVDSVIEMIKGGMPDSVIVNSVRNQNLKFGMDDLMKLHKGGASPALLEALSGGTRPASEQPPEAPKAAPAAPADAVPLPAATMPSVDLNAVRCEAPKEARKRVLAVEDFDFGAVKTKDQAVFNTEVAVGKGMAALAIKRLGEAARFRVVERAKLTKAIEEQDRGASTRMKQGTTARSGRVIGADAILLGTITIFGTDDKQKGIGGYFGKIWGPLGRVKLKFTTNKFIVAVNYRLVDAETTEVIGQGDARGEAERKGKGVDIGGILGGTAAGGSLDMTSTNFLETIVGEATIAAMDKLMADLNERESKIPLHFIDATSRIANIEGANLYISAGSVNGVQPCDRFTVSRIVKEITDPLTHELLDLQLRKIGEMVVTEVKDKMSFGVFQGTEPPQVKDVAEKVKPPAPPVAENRPPAPAAK